MQRVHSFLWQFHAGGRTLADEGLSAKFELISSFALTSQSSFISYKKQKTNNIRIRSLNVWYIKTIYLIVMKFTGLTEWIIKILYFNFLSDLKCNET